MTTSTTTTRRLRPVLTAELDCEVTSAIQAEG